MATFTSIRTKVKAKLDTVAELAFVADFHDPNIKGYPAATFDVSDETSAFLTNKENLRTITFQIILYQEIKTLGLAETTGLLDAVADKVILAFEKDFSLGGEVQWCIPLAGPRGQFESPSGAVLFQQLTLQCNFSFLAI